MPYNVTPDLQLRTTNKGDGEKFDQNVLNDNFIKLDSRSAALRAAATVSDRRIGELESPNKLPVGRWSSRVNGAANAALYNQGPITVISDPVIDSSFASLVNPTSTNLTSNQEPAWLLKRGAYVVTVAVNVSSTMSARSFTELRINTANKYRYSWAAANEDTQTWSWAFNADADDTRIQFWFYKQTTASTSDIVHTYHLLKVR